VEKMALSARDYSDVLKQLKIGYAYSEIKEGDARKLPLDDSSMDGILTSPPYSIALDYVKNDRHALEALGLDLEGIRDGFIGVRGRPKDKVSIYNKDMAVAYREMYRVLRPGKFCTIVIGDATVDEKRLPTVKNTISTCKGFGFKLVHNIEKIIFGLYNVMQKENILVFKKED
jgi:DNA modification methylase